MFVEACCPPYAGIEGTGRRKVGEHMESGRDKIYKNICKGLLFYNIILVREVTCRICKINVVSVEASHKLKG